MRRIIAPIVFVLIGIVATVVVMITNGKPDLPVSYLVLLWVVVLVSSLISIPLTKPKYIPTPAGEAILTCLREGDKGATAIHEWLRESNFLISRDGTYEEIRALKERGLISAGNQLPVVYKITPQGRLTLD